MPPPHYYAIYAISADIDDAAIYSLIIAIDADIFAIRHYAITLLINMIAEL